MYLAPPRAEGQISRAEQIAAIAFALTRFAFCCYRAARQSIVIDEAFTFSRFVKGPWSSFYAPYDANNHVLHSILAKLSIMAFGLSEVTLRLPSLVAGFFLVLGLFRLLHLLTRSWLIRWVALLALGLHPLLLDFSVAARGYSLGLACFIWAFCLVLQGRHALAGILLGLAMSANLAMIFPAVALMFSAAILKDGSLAGRLKALAALLVPAATVFGAICFASLRSARREFFYTGYASLGEALSRLIFASIRADLVSPGLIGTSQWTNAIETFWLPVVGLFILTAAGRDLLRKGGVRQRFLPLLTLGGTIGGFVAVHHLFGIKYPLERGCLYVVLLFGTAWAVAVDCVSNKALRLAQLGLAGVLTLQFVTQIQATYFQGWPFDMSAREIAEILKAECAGKTENSIAVSATWLHQPSLEFYRDYLRITALQPVQRLDKAPLSGHDYYVLSGTDAKEAERLGLRILFHNRLPGVILASQR